MFFFYLYSIFRVFSADRKRVETALENCNLPSGRVREQNIKTLCFFFFFFSNMLQSPCTSSVYKSASTRVSFLSRPFCLISVFKLFNLLHPSISRSSRHLAHYLSSWSHDWLPLRSFVWSHTFCMSAWLPTQNWFSRGRNTTNRPTGSNKDDKSCFMTTFLFKISLERSCLLMQRRASSPSAPSLHPNKTAASNLHPWKWQKCCLMKFQTHAETYGHTGEQKRRSSYKWLLNTNRGNAQKNKHTERGRERANRLNIISTRKDDRRRKKHVAVWRSSGICCCSIAQVITAKWYCC